MVTFSGGIAAFLGLSPLFVCMIMGVVVVNLSRSKERVIQTLTQAEKPIYLILLVWAGAIWRFGSPEFLLLAGAYWGVRLIGKVLGGYVAIRGLAAIPSPWTVGLTLVSQGGVAIAIVLNFQQAYDLEIGNAVTTIVLLSVMANELISPYSARKVLSQCEET
jgi:hypothetical protein